MDTGWFNSFGLKRKRQHRSIVVLRATLGPYRLFARAGHSLMVSEDGELAEGAPNTGIAKNKGLLPRTDAVNQSRGWPWGVASRA